MIQTTLEYVMNVEIQRGFTLIELMIVVAIIGLLASFAIPAYQQYIQTTNMSKVNTHFEEAARFARHEIKRTRTNLSIGSENLAQAGARLDTTQAWVDSLNSEAANARAPEGSFLPYNAVEDDATGVVGIAVTAGSVASVDLQITVTRPAYSAYASTSGLVINW